MCTTLLACLLQMVPHMLYNILHILNVQVVILRSSFQMQYYRRGFLFFFYEINHKEEKRILSLSSKQKI